MGAAAVGDWFCSVGVAITRMSDRSGLNEPIHPRYQNVTEAPADRQPIVSGGPGRPAPKDNPWLGEP